MKPKPNSAGRMDLSALPRDFTAGVVVFLVALPLCLGVAALVPGVEKFSGLISGVIGGVIVGVLSGSHTSVSGPSPGLIAVLIAQMAILGSFPALLMAIMLAGVIQVGMGIARLGFIASFFPSSVIKGLLAAIGVILVLKQLPHVIGHDIDPEGDLSFWQLNRENTFTELGAMFADLNWGATIIGLASIAIIVAWHVDLLHAASVWSKNIDTALTVSRRVRAGRFWVNCIMAGGPEMPLGGFKQSGWGREAGVYGVEEYTQVKSVHVEIGKRSHWIK